MDFWINLHTNAQEKDLCSNAKLSKFFLTSFHLSVGKTKQ